MTRDELKRIVRNNNSTTLVANRFRRALGLREIWRGAPHRGQLGRGGKAKAKYVNRGRYKHAKSCMKQRYGVKL